MNWFSDDHKKLYSQAFGALCEDVKNGTGSLITGTGNLLTSGYQKLVQGIDDLDKKYNTPNDIDKNINDSVSDVDMSGDVDDYLVNIGKTYPDVIIKLHKERTNIVKIWVIENDRTLKPITGKIDSYQYISTLIHKWFIYEQRGNIVPCKWYPTDELYTAYRESSNRLNHMIYIRFHHGQNGYLPFHYSPIN